jgi:hypothetical protein
MAVTDFFTCLRVVLKRLCVAFMSSIAQRNSKEQPRNNNGGRKGTKERRNEREREREKENRPHGVQPPAFVSVSRSPNHVLKYAISRQVPNHILKSVTWQSISRSSNYILKSVTSLNPAISHALKSKPGDDISTNALFTCGNCATLFFLPHMGLAILY